MVLGRSNKRQTKYTVLSSLTQLYTQVKANNINVNVVYIAYPELCRFKEIVDISNNNKPHLDTPVQSKTFSGVFTFE